MQFEKALLKYSLFMFKPRSKYVYAYKYAYILLEGDIYVEHIYSIIHHTLSAIIYIKRKYKEKKTSTYHKNHKTERNISKKNKTNETTRPEYVSEELFIFL